MLNMSSDNECVLPLARLCQLLINRTLNVPIYAEASIPSFGFMPLSSVSFLLK